MHRPESEREEPREAASIRGLTPGRAWSGTLRPPDSKSFAQRILLAAALAEGTTRIRIGASAAGDDARAAAALAAGLGARVEAGPGTWIVHGLGLGVRRCLPRAVETLDAGESATLARLATAVVALRGSSDSSTTLEARGTLRARTSDPLVEALVRAGARLDRASESVGHPRGTWPLRIRAAPDTPSALELVDPVSSQEVSALWLAAAAGGRRARVSVRGRIRSRPYLAITRGVLAAFGVRLERAGDRDEELDVEGPLRAPDGALELEADASSAAVALAGACLSGGGVKVTGIPSGSAQGDARVVDHLRRFGCDAGRRGGELWAGGRPTRAVHVDLSNEPDLVPVLAAVAAGAASSADGPTRLLGIGALRGKESDRLATLEQGLRTAGWDARAGPDELWIGGAAEGSTRARPVVLDPRGDHRMAFAFALLGLVRPGLRVAASGCVAKSWPSFWDDATALGATVAEGLD